MFTGLIEECGTVRWVGQAEGGLRLAIGCAKVMGDLAVGDSLAVNGVCQTVVERGSDRVWVEVVATTVQKTTLGSLVAGDRVNLERACRADSRLGGHLVTGHVTGVGSVVGWTDRGLGWILEVLIPVDLGRYVVAEGSVTVDGVSLTVAARTDRGFRVEVIPHTRQATNLATLRPGNRVNLEVDLVAKYVESLLGSGPTASVDRDRLTAWGYR